MILRIKEFFETRLLITHGTTQSSIDERLKLSCAVLMYEMIHVDGEAHESETQKISQLLQQQFNISNQEIKELLSLAHEEKHSATDYYRFTSLINEHYSQEQKIGLIKQLWNIAYADNTLDKFEEHLVRKLADLLHVPHRHFLQSKHQVENES
ncbi:MAG: TerB family tellurite resistance protein [Gammaproteobacteria bacterium]|nr:TerB family tellurite resistance protein [Gammaproteobacteria bacterium]